jgi:hypothetical protein
VVLAGGAFGGGNPLAGDVVAVGWGIAHGCLL